jgi:ribonuclease PH
MTREDGRRSDQIRPVGFSLRPQRNPEGSLIYRSGDTSVLIAASVSEKVPDWMRTPKQGWVTAEYEMHPRANPRRRKRDRIRGAIDGRSQEIQRLIGRSLRAAVDLSKLGERTIQIDCDVLDADGGTRTASITGAFVAVAMALDGLRKRGLVDAGVLREPVAAISVGWLEGRPLLNLCYTEDRDAEVDLNVVAAASGGIVEVQGTAEGAPLPREHFDRLVDVALAAMPELVATQRRALEEAGVDLDRLLPART